jgi:alginate O-acetyltransferase complex protein AlgI
MLVIIGGVLTAMKGIVSVEAAARHGTRLPPLRWLAFATSWPGMRPGLFTRPAGERPGARPGAWRLVARGFLRAAAGAGLIALARVLWGATESPGAATVVLLTGLSLLVHFGMFTVLAGAWRLAGADTSPLFQAPLRSASIGEFWSRRWNIAFSEMTALAVYGPLAGVVGRRHALIAGFLFSGLLHEAAISLPVGAGFGGPLLFFALHGALARIERERGPFGRVATLLWVVLPLPLLFHLPFLRGVVWPLLGAAD